MSKSFCDKHCKTDFSLFDLFVSEGFSCQMRVCRQFGRVMDASLLKPVVLTVMYCNFREDAIRQQPDMYLWSRKWFKFDWTDEYQKMWIYDRPV